MKYIIAFIYCGIVCSLSQLIFEKTKLTIGHINTILVIVGCILSGLKIYDKILSLVGTGASTLIINFGYLLVKGSSEGFNNYGIIGLFKGLYSYASCGLSVAIISAFIVSIIFKVKH